MNKQEFIKRMAKVHKLLEANEGKMLTCDSIYEHISLKANIFYNKEFRLRDKALFWLDGFTKEAFNGFSPFTHLSDIREDRWALREWLLYWFEIVSIENEWYKEY